MFEKEAIEYRKDLKSKYFLSEPQLNLACQGFKDGYNKAMKEWRDCFLSCSSPYCADKFKDIRSNGMLGNMSKEVKK